MEFGSLGKYCYKCNNLDFLPVFCTKCNQFYCKDHYKKNKHKCISKNEDPYNAKLINKSSNDENQNLENKKYINIENQNDNEFTKPLINNKNQKKNKKKIKNCFIQ